MGVRWSRADPECEHRCVCSVPARKIREVEHHYSERTGRIQRQETEIPPGPLSLHTRHGARQTEYVTPAIGPHVCRRPAVPSSKELCTITNQALMKRLVGE